MFRAMIYCYHQINISRNVVLLCKSCFVVIVVDQIFTITNETETTVAPLFMLQKVRKRRKQGSAVSADHYVHRGSGWHRFVDGQRRL